MLRFLFLLLQNTEQIPYFKEFLSLLSFAGFFETTPAFSTSEALQALFSEITACSSYSPSQENSATALLFARTASADDCLLLTDSDAVLERFGEKCPCIGLVNPSLPAQSLTKAYALLESLESVDISYLERTCAHAKGLPATICTTPRLLLREFAMSDFEALYALRSRPENNRYLTERPETKITEAKKLSAYISTVYPFCDFALWGVFDRETGTLIGQVGFSLPSFKTAANDALGGSFAPFHTDPSATISPDTPNLPSFGYMIDLPYRNKGYAREAVRAALTYAKELGLSECIVQIQKENTASQKVLSGCGFPYEYCSVKNNLFTYLLTLSA